MADNDVANCGIDDQSGEESTTKIVMLQSECDELVNENVERKEEIKRLTTELNSLLSDDVVNSKKNKKMQIEVV